MNGTKVSIDVADVSVLAVITRLTEKNQDRGIDSSIKRTYKLTIAGGIRKLARADLFDEIRDNFEIGCQCSHDCCGHWFGGARGFKVRRGAVFFSTSYSRNV